MCLLNQGSRTLLRLTLPWSLLRRWLTDKDTLRTSSRGRCLSSSSESYSCLQAKSRNFLKSISLFYFCQKVWSTSGFTEIHTYSQFRIWILVRTIEQHPCSRFTLLTVWLCMCPRCSPTGWLRQGRENHLHHHHHHHHHHHYHQQYHH